VISVIIPVGPGHEKNVIDALDSLEAQTFRKWECIVVWDMEEGPPQNLMTAYPYVRWRGIGRGGNGAGWTRNFGATFARAPFLFFLDADDWLYDNEALQKMLDVWNEYKAIPYSDYMGRSFIEDPNEVNKLANAGRLVAYNENTHEALTRFQAFDFDCERVLRQPELPNPYTFCLISTLVPKIWHDEIGGFDEAMPSWEDVDYHWRMVRNGKCYVRIEESLLLYRFYTGTRREGGRQEFKNLVKYISEKYEKEGEIVCWLAR
jgi:glycosyltransferase involved in cell wall biosynthesis